MKLLFDKYEYIKTKLEGIEFEIPEESFAFQEDNHRIMTLVVPDFNSWLNDEDDRLPLYAFDITRVSRNISDYKIESVKLVFNKQTVENMFLTMSCKNSYDLREEVLDYMVNHFTEDRISSDLFINIYKIALEDLSKRITTKSKKDGR